jgi:hemoglobin
MASLYEQLGGAGAVAAVVPRFYRKVLADKRLARFFDGVDIERLIAKQTAFLSMAFGGPHSYSSRDLSHVHAHLLCHGLDDVHVDAVLEHLRDTLAELGVNADLVAQVMTLCDSLRDHVLSRSSPVRAAAR